MPYAQLPLSQRIKDFIFKSIVNAYYFAVHQENVKLGTEKPTPGEEGANLDLDNQTNSQAIVIKELTARAIDFCHRKHIEKYCRPPGKQDKYLSLAITNYQTAAMFAVMSLAPHE